MTKRRRRLWIPISLAVIIVAGYAGREAWLTALGRFLVKTDLPRKAEIAVVLAGDGYGKRIMKAADLVRQGYVPRVLVDGPIFHYEVPESDLAIDFAVRYGARREIFDPFPMDARSTLQEARLVDRELQRRGIRSALVVTSNFHTRRARHIFGEHGSGQVTYTFVQAPHPDFRPENWWHTREGQKLVVLEYMKTLHSWWE